MCAIAFLNKEKFIRAKEVAGEDKVKLVEEYKRIGGAFKEGTNEVIESTKKYDAVFDEAPVEEPKKAGKSKEPKLGKVKKRGKK